MREQTNCRIMISDSIPQVHERVLTVIGTVEMVGRAYTLIAEQIERVCTIPIISVVRIFHLVSVSSLLILVRCSFVFQEAKQHDPNANRIFINLLVPNQQTGAIIGKGNTQKFSIE